jgi:hypothetical protein
MIAAIHFKHHTSPIDWHTHHVKGHQDDYNNLNQLDRWSKLNIEADLIAKNHLQQAASTPSQYTIATEPWSIWMEGEKITKNIKSVVYERLHSSPAQQY